MDFLAAGLDPEKSALFIQSHVVQHAELHLLLSMITSLGWLERVPSYKDQQENIVGKDLTTYGFLGYPLLQSADILVYQPAVCAGRTRPGRACGADYGRSLVDSISTILLLGFDALNLGLKSAKSGSVQSRTGTS